MHHSSSRFESLAFSTSLKYLNPFQDVEPLFEEQCEGNQLRLEFLSWFRLRLNDKTIRATNLGEDNRSHIFIESERADINDEVKKKEDELRQRLKKLGADNKSSSGLVPNG